MGQEPVRPAPVFNRIMEDAISLRLIGPIENDDHLMLIAHGDRFFRIPDELWRACCNTGGCGCDANVDVRADAVDLHLDSNAASPELRDAARRFFALLHTPSVKKTRLRPLADFDVGFVVYPLAGLLARYVPLRAAFVLGLICLALNIAYLIIEPTRPSYGEALGEFGGWKFAAAAGLLLTIFFLHEIAHCVSSVLLGCQAHRIGFGLLIVMPAFFADVSEIWKLSGRKRAAVGAAGILAQAYVGALLLLIMPLLPEWRAVLQFVVLVSASVMVLNIMPFAKLDGYWIVSDLLDVKDLRSEVRARIRHPIASAGNFSGGGARERIVTLYALTGTALAVWFLVWIALHAGPTAVRFATDPHVPAFTTTNVGIAVFAAIYLGVRIFENRARLFPGRRT